MAQHDDPRPRADVRANWFAYTVETAAGETLGACVSAPLAAAMYHAALEEYFSRKVRLKKGGAILAETR
jgi:hypothetical protein